MRFLWLALLVAALAGLAGAESPDVIRKEIEASYARALDAMLHAKSMQDLDEMNHSFDTLDWRSISPGQQPRTWEDLRQYGFAGIWAPFQSLQFIVDSFELNGDAAILKGRLRTVNMKGDVGFVPLKETFRRTVMGWKRQIHQKFRPGETPN
jgi:hypothetical protein